MPRELPLLLLAVSMLAAFACGPTESADILLVNGNIHTVDENLPKAEAIAIHGDRILFVGSNTEAESYEGASTVRIDLEGKTVLPGLSDSHVHLSGVGFRALSLNLEGTAGLDEMLQRVQQYAERVPSGEWIVGGGWIEAQWNPPVFPTRQDIDRVVPNHPVWLIRADGHGAVANSKALDIAGVTRSTTSPAGGEIMRDARTGEPSGMLLDNAKSLVSDYIPDPSPEREREALLVGARVLMQRGWTAISIAGNSYEDIERIRGLYNEGEIKIRI